MRALSFGVTSRVLQYDGTIGSGWNDGGTT